MYVCMYVRSYTAHCVNAVRLGQRPRPTPCWSHCSSVGLAASALGATICIPDPKPKAQKQYLDHNSRYMREDGTPVVLYTQTGVTQLKSFFHLLFHPLSKVLSQLVVLLTG